MDIQLEVGASGGNLLETLKQVRGQLAEQQEVQEKLNKTQQEGAKASIAGADEWMKKQNELLDIQSRQTEQLKAQQKALHELRQKYDELNKSSSTGLDPKGVKQYTDQINNLKREIADLRAQIEGKGGKGKLQVFAEGSREEAVATVKRIRAELDSMTAAQLKSNPGKYLRAELKVAEKELENLTKLSGQAAEKTGNVFNKAWGFLRQAAYLIPGLGIAGIIGLIADAVIDLGKQFLKVNEIQKDFKEINVEAAKATVDEKVKLESLLKVARDETASKEAKKNAIKGINDLMPEYNDGINQENINTAETNKRITEYIQKLDAKAKGQAYVSKISAKYTELIDVENSALQDNIKWYERLWVTIKNGGNIVNVAAEENARSAINRENARKKVMEDIGKLQEALNKELLAGTARLDEEDKKTTEKRLREFKDRSDKIIALEKQIADLRIQAMENGRQKEIEIENAKYDDINKVAVNKTKQYLEEIEKLRKDKNISDATRKREIEQLTSLIRLENQVIEQEKLSHAARLLAIDMKYFDDAKKALEESNNAISEVLLKDEEKEVDSVRKKYDKLFKQIEEARKKALQALNNPVAISGANLFFDNKITELTEKQEKEKIEVKRKYALKSLQQDEDLKIAEAGLLKKKGADTAELERYRQTEILKIQIEFAQKRIELLSGSTEKEDKVTVAKLKASIEKMKLELEKLSAKQAKSINIYNMLGLNMTDKERQDFEMAARSVTDSLLSIWASYVNKRVEQSEQILQQLQTEIEKQESVVDEQKRLKEEGLANDLNVEQQRLDDLKRRNNEQIAELKKAQKEQETYAKAQQVIQGVIAGTKLAASAAEYFASGSTYGPVVGLALSLAAIATMVATFTSFKNQTKQLSNFQTYRGGGDYDATGSDNPTHEQGGIDVMINGKKKAEFEKGEYAYFFKDGKKAKTFKPFFDAINEGKLSKWHVDPIGLHIPEQTFKTVVSAQNSGGNDNGYLYEINNNVKKMAASKMEVEYVNGYRIERMGNHVRKIKMNNGAV